MKSAIDKHVAAGLEELAAKSMHQIQVETAYKWAGRAIAATALGKLDDAHEYAHEAVEHGALAGDDTLRVVRAAFRKHRIAP